MREVSDAFLLNVAEVTAAFVGLFLVGIFFFVETGLHRGRGDDEAVAAYFRSGTRITLIVFAIPLLLSMTLVAMDAVWSHLLFAALSLLLIAANVDSVRRIRAASGEMRAPSLTIVEAIGTAAVVLIVTLPWILGGIDPSREELAWAIMLAFATGFLSVSAIVLSAFDLTRPAPENRAGSGGPATSSALAEGGGEVAARENREHQAGSG